MEAKEIREIMDRLQQIGRRLEALKADIEQLRRSASRPAALPLPASSGDPLDQPMLSEIRQSSPCQPPARAESIAVLGDDLLDLGFPAILKQTGRPVSLP